MTPEPSSFGGGPGSALCALHPERSAGRTCQRCGNFMCDECSLGGSEVNCPTCRTMLGGTAFPLDRSNVTFGGVWNFAMEHFKREWVMLSVLVLVYGMASFVGSLAGNVLNAMTGLAPEGTARIVAMVIGQLLAFFLSSAATGAVLLGMYRVYFDVLAGGKADLGRAFTQFAKLPRYLGQLLMVFLMTSLPLLLIYGLMVGGYFLVNGSFSNFDLDHPERFFRDSGGLVVLLAVASLVILPVFIYLTIPLQFAVIELVYSDCGAWDCITRSYAIAKDFRLLTFGTGLVGSLLLVAGIFACCVGTIPALALMQMLMTTLFLALRRGADVPPPPSTI